VDIKDLFELHLEPMKSDIKELKEGQLQLIEIIKIQTRHDETIIKLKEDIKDCKENHKTKNSRIFEVIKLGIAAFIGAITGKIF